MENLTDGEKAALSNQELHNRCTAVIGALNAVGIISHEMSTAELIELVYSCYNREGFSYAEAISSNEAFAMLWMELKISSLTCLALACST